jgi:hypothetical protein
VQSSPQVIAVFNAEEALARCYDNDEAGEAIEALEHECIALKAALANHPLVVEPTQDDSR